MYDQAKSTADNDIFRPRLAKTVKLQDPYVPLPSSISPVRRQKQNQDYYMACTIISTNSTEEPRVLLYDLYREPLERCKEDNSIKSVTCVSSGVPIHYFPYFDGGERIDDEKTSA